MDDNNNSRMVLDKKLGELSVSLSDFHALISRNDALSANSSLQQSMTELHSMLKKVDSDFMGYNGDKVITEKSGHHNANSESLSGPNSSSKSPSSPFAHYSSVKLENKTGVSVDLNNHMDSADTKKNGSEASDAQNYKNSTVTELKTLENEILVALKRLEKTNSSLELEKEK